eukprot:67364_1
MPCHPCRARECVCGACVLSGFPSGVVALMWLTGDPTVTDSAGKWCTVWVSGLILLNIWALTSTLCFSYSCVCDCACCDSEDGEREERTLLAPEERAMQRKYGHTQNGQFIDLKVMKQLMQMGMEKEIVIEALRQCNNTHQQTLNLCLDPQQKETLTQTLFARHLNDNYLYKIEQIISALGAYHVKESRVRAA